MEIAGMAIGLVIGISILIFIVWLSALLVGAKNKTIVSCVISFVVNSALTYMIKLVVPELLISTIIMLPITGFVNSKILETSFVRGVLVSIITGLLLAGWVSSTR